MALRWTIAVLALALPAGASASTFALESMRPAFDPVQPSYVFDCSEPRALSIDGESLMSEVLPVGIHRATVRATPGQAVMWQIAGRTYRALCQPGDFPEIDVTRTGTPGADYYATTPTSIVDRRYMMLLDGAGVPTWWLRDDARPRDLKLIDGDTLAYGVSSNGRNGWYRLIGWDGSEQLKIGATLGVGQHDLQRTERGTYLINRHVPGRCPEMLDECVDLSPWNGGEAVNPLQSEIAEFAADGTLIGRWNSHGHVNVAEAARWIPEQAEKTTHLNSIEPDGDGVLVTMRHTDAVYRIDWATGAIEWKLGGTTTPGSLTVIGDPLAPNILGGPHDVRVLERLGGGVTRISVSDNATGLLRRPRAVVYDVNAAAGTATFVHQVHAPIDAAPTSRCCGSSRPLPDGWMLTFGDNPTISDVDFAGRERLRITFPEGVTSYRAVPVLTRDHPGVPQAMQEGMRAMYGMAEVTVTERPPAPVNTPSMVGAGAPPRASVTITRAPRAVTRSRVSGVRFDVVGAGAECRINGARWRPCRSPLRVRHRASGGIHTVRVRAVGADGTRSASQVLRWRVLPVK